MKIKKIFPYLILASGFIISISAAFFSVDGFAKFFAGASTKIIFMIGSMEFAKIIVTSAVKIYWKNWSLSYKISGISATIVLMILTSCGIYGFLSAAYQQTSHQNSLVEKGVELLNSKKERFVEQKTELESEKTKLLTDINTLRTDLAGAKSEYIDRKSGQKISSSSTSALKVYQEQLNESTNRRDNLASKIDNLNDSINYYDIKILEARTNNESINELGPLIYIQKLTNWDIDKIANILILLLMAVFDPLAILMLTMSITILLGEFNVISKDTANSNTNINISPTENVAENTPEESLSKNIETTKSTLNEKTIEQTESAEPIVELEKYFSKDNKTINDQHQFYHGKKKLNKQEEKDMSEWQKKHKQFN